MANFLTDVQTLRDKARTEIAKGPVTSAYGADLTRVITVLNDALATELVCTLRYTQHHHAAKGMNSEPVAAEFLQHAQEERDHAEQLATRIDQLGGVPDYNPASLTERSHSEYRTAATLTEMIQENLVAERIAIASYTEIVNWLGEDDPTTRRVFETILAKEEEHADDMLTFLEHPS